MKQYLTPEQTAKLIELGFEKPKSEVRSEGGIFTSNARKAYSIGELIEMLPPRYNGEDLEIHRNWGFEQWIIYYRGDDAEVETELIDALYDMIIFLNKEGII